MRRIDSPTRLLRLAMSVIERIRLDLRGITVLTEVASGPFVVTPLLAALAGADHVNAVTRNSAHGQAEEVIDYGRSLARQFGVAERIEFSSRPAAEFAASSSLVTNLGFVRPIQSDIIEKLPGDAVIALMWEPWEFRQGDIDLEACRQWQIPVVGTNETHPDLRIFNYVGILAIKLLLECNIEVSRSRICVVGSDPFGTQIRDALSSLGAEIIKAGGLQDADAVILAENRDPSCLIGPGGIDPATLARAGTRVIHICGAVDHGAMLAAGLEKHPVRHAPFGYMTVTTDYVGMRPVVDLHAGGLKVGQIVVNARRAGAELAEAAAASVRSGFGLPLFPEVG